MGTINIVEVLAAALRLRASDIHLSAGAAPLVRVDGRLVAIPGYPALTQETCKMLVYSMLSEAQRAKFEEDFELDLSLSLADKSRFRVNVLTQRGRVEAALRPIPGLIPGPEMLGLGPMVMSLADLPRGLVLVTGPTGSGKSTTLACLIDHINQNYPKHIITIEDPIEFIYPKGRALVRQREVGPDTHSFQTALRQSLREDPDVILVGEMRDLETIALTLTAAETGHLCFSTLHTLGAADTLDRILDVFPPQQQAQVRVQLANSLRAVVSQMLLPRSDGKGRIAARELMLVNPAIANLIRESKTHMIQNTIETGGSAGMFTIDRALAELVRRGIVSRGEALARAQDPERLGSLLSRLTTVS